MPSLATDYLLAPRPPIAILGVPFDVVTSGEAIALIERMITSRRPHYIVTPNIDFLVQASEDIELRRILFEAHLVVCDGTPLLWASRLLGNPLPERVAGADLVPLLIRLAARKGYRLFFLGASEDSCAKAVARLRSEYPDLIIAGYYSPPFNQLLEMDHERIKERIQAAHADLLLVSFGCPKQEKWMAMHYRTLEVPVTAGVGGTIDFLAGQVKRAPVWMQRAGAEWIFRLSQEPRRLFRRYTKDLWVFSRAFLAQWWELRPLRGNRSQASARKRLACANSETPQVAPLEDESSTNGIGTNQFYYMRLPERLDFQAVRQTPHVPPESPKLDRHWLVEASMVSFIDSTGVGCLIQWQKRLQAVGRYLVLVAPSPGIQRALSLLRLQEFFLVAQNAPAALDIIAKRQVEQPVTRSDKHMEGGLRSSSIRLAWHGEVTAANAAAIWQQSIALLQEPLSTPRWIIDLSDVRFMDSSGLGLLVRLKKLERDHQKSLVFEGIQPAVRNVIQIARLTEFLAESVCQAR